MPYYNSPEFQLRMPKYNYNALHRHFRYARAPFSIPIGGTRIFSQEKEENGTPFYRIACGGHPLIEFYKNGEMHFRPNREMTIEDLAFLLESCNLDISIVSYPHRGGERHFRCRRLGRGTDDVISVIRCYAHVVFDHNALFLRDEDATDVTTPLESRSWQSVLTPTLIART